jgi:hypothetical protein
LWIAQIKYIVATSTLCPAMAVLGAKRPQDKGWTFIVASLWLVLILPALQTMVFGYGSELELHWAWRSFLLFLMIAGWSNYVLTRFWFAACLLAAAQSVLLGKHLPGIGIALGDRSVPIAMILLGATSLIVLLQTNRQSAKKSSANGVDRVWRDFRDAFGAVWGLRIMERVNALSAQQGWSRTLQWSGFEPTAELKNTHNAESADADHGNSDKPPSEQLERDQIEQCLHTLLRRFVYPDWIDRRLRD